MTVEELKRKFREYRNVAAAITVAPVLFGGMITYVSALLLYTFLKDDQETLKCHACNKSFDFERTDSYYEPKAKTLYVYCPHCFTKNIYQDLNNYT